MGKSINRSNTAKYSAPFAFRVALAALLENQFVSGAGRHCCYGVYFGVAMGIFLLGYSGVGKTYWAARLAAALRAPFYDLDACIEKRAQQTIAALFLEKQEAGFRVIERACLLSFQQKKRLFVLACGGGTPCFYDNMRLINQMGRSIYLRASIEELYERLVRGDLAHRPLLRYTLSALKQHIAQTLAQRRIFYEQAHRTISIKDLSLERLLTVVRDL